MANRERCNRMAIRRMLLKTFRRMSFDRFGRRLRMAKGKRNIGREILRGCARLRAVATDVL